MRSEQQILVNLDEVHRLLHVFEQLMSPHDLATQRGHVVAQGRVVTLVLIQLQQETVSSCSHTLTMYLLDFINFT